MIARSACTRKLSAGSTRAAYTGSLVLALSVLTLGCEGWGSDARSVDAGRSLFARTAPASAGLDAPDSVVTTTRHLPVEAGDISGRTASISGDGRSIVTTDWATGEIVIRELRGGSQRQLFRNQDAFNPGFGMHPHITGDGHRVAYTWVPMVGDSDGQGPELRVIDLSQEGAEPTTLFASTVWVRPLDWSPDGREILAGYAREDGTGQIIIVPLDGSQPRLLRSLGWNGSRGVAFSPDGRWVAFDFTPEDHSWKRDIQVVATDGSAGRIVVEGESDDWLLGWSPQGNLLFVSDRGGTPGAWQLPMSDGRAAGAPELVKPDLWRISPLGFDGEGRLFYVHMEGGAGVHVASLDPESGRIAGIPSKVDLRAHGRTRQPAWSPDGRHLAYLTEERPFSGTGDQILRIRAMESGDVRELRVPPPTQGLANPGWTPDGRAILLRAQYDRGETNLLRVDVQTGAVERVLRDADLYPGFEVLPDGRRILFAERLQRPLGEVRPADGEPRGGQRLVVRGLDDDSEVELYRHIGITVNPHLTIRHVALSPDGSRVAFTRTHRWGEDGSSDLVVMDVEGGDPEVVAEFNRAMVTTLAWSSDGRYLLYGLSNEHSFIAEANLWRVRPGESPEELGYFPEGLRILKPHPDGRRIAFEMGWTEPSVWVMENIAPVVRGGEAGGRR